MTENEWYIVTLKNGSKIKVSATWPPGLKVNDEGKVCLTFGLDFTPYPFDEIEKIQPMKETVFSQKIIEVMSEFEFTEEERMLCLMNLTEVFIERGFVIGDEKVKAIVRQVEKAIKKQTLFMCENGFID